MARPSESYNLRSSPSGISRNPSKIFTSSGSSNSSANVCGFSNPVSLESTGLMQWFLIAASWLSSNSPSMTYVVAERIIGSSFSFNNFTHCSAESARWSYCPGRYSTLNTFAPAASNVSSYTSSTGGSENTVFKAF